MTVVSVPNAGHYLLVRLFKPNISHCNGIKGPSILSEIPDSDHIECTVCEIIYLAFLGYLPIKMINQIQGSQSSHGHNGTTART